MTEKLRHQRKLDAMDRLLEQLGIDDISSADLEAVRAEWQ